MTMELTMLAAILMPTLWQVLSPYLGVLVMGFVVSLIATPICRRLAMANGIVDWPDLKRKNHAVPVAYMGGVAIFLGWLAAVGLSYFLPAHPIDTHILSTPRVMFPISIILGAVAVVVTGLFDDVYGIRARVKVGGQLFAAAALASQDIGVKLVYNALGVLNIPVNSLNGIVIPVFNAPLGDMIVYTGGTALVAMFVLGACNAVNLIDGLDGLASGVVAIAAVGFLVMSLLIATRGLDPDTFALQFRWDPVRIVICLALLGAILGFLPYNFNPASIFMGDAGSLLLGYLAATCILLFSDTGGHALKLVTAALIVFAVPITDTSLAIIRRKIRGYPIFAPDNQHIHHLLRRSGLSVKKSVLVMYGAGAIFATLGIIMVGFDWSWRYILVVFILLYGTIMAIAFKYGAYQLALEQQRQAERALEARIAQGAPIDQPTPGYKADEAHPDPDTSSVALTVPTARVPRESLN